MKPSLKELLATHAMLGRVDWIGLRPQRLADVQSYDTIEVGEAGPEGDHSRKGKRALTLIQAEHLPVIAALAGIEEARPEILRRNIVVSGINLTALRHSRIRIGSAEIAFTVPCAPCSRMHEAMGPGAYNAMRGHGGWCAEILAPGRISIGDSVEVLGPHD